VLRRTSRWVPAWSWLRAVSVNRARVLGDLVIVNTGATVDHDCVLEEGVHVSPGCHLTGNVTCRRMRSWARARSSFPAGRFGAWAVVGAGAS